MWQIIGQERIVSFLKRGLEEGKLAHAYLLVGPRYVGKGTLALDFAKAINCIGKDPPCGECSHCLRIAQGIHSDVRTISLPFGEKTNRPKTAIGIEQIKDIINSAHLPPFEGKYKVFIIDGAEYLSPDAANALLKTLEEPPDKVIFLLLTAKEEALLPTIISRCQRLELRPIPQKQIVQALIERWGLSPERAQILSRTCRGCLGGAVRENLFPQREKRLSQLHQILSQGKGERLIFAGELASQFESDREGVWDELGFWQIWWRDLLLIKAGREEDIVNIDQRDVLKEQAKRYSLQQIKGAIYSIERAIEELRLNASPRLVLEVLMMDLP